MSTSSIMIVAKGKPVTDSIRNYYYDSRTAKWSVTYKNGKAYWYKSDNVEILEKPDTPDPKEYQIAIHGKSLREIAALEIFRGHEDTYWRICLADGNVGGVSRQGVGDQPFRAALCTA